MKETTPLEDYLRTSTSIFHGFSTSIQSGSDAAKGLLSALEQTSQLGGVTSASDPERMVTRPLGNRC
jgi:hypothetical protein